LGEGLPLRVPSRSPAGVKPLDVSVDYVMSFPVLKYAKEQENIIKAVAN
jgi:hypothetical protein